MRKIEGEAKQIGIDGNELFSQNRFYEKPRLDLNDLIKRRKLEKIGEKKTNILIFSYAVAFVFTVVVVFSLLR